MKNGKTVPLTPPPGLTGISAETVASGLSIPAIDRIKIFNSTQWEEFILEWADSLRDQYRAVERCGGAGDMGRDVVATCANIKEGWDNYQCKHYRDPLTPSDVWIELGKLVYYTYLEEYTYPRNYYFVAPQGAGTKLSNLFKKPEVLKAELSDAWNEKCRAKITSTTNVDLDSPLRAYLEDLNFGIFAAVPPLRIIDDHARTRWYAARFGGGLPPRPQSIIPPTSPTTEEATYIRALLDAYSEHLDRHLAMIENLSLEDSDLLDHFNDSRNEFWSAQSLQGFSRDTLPPGEFGKLQEEIYSGIKDEIRHEHPNGYRRVVEVLKTARALQLSAHALHSRVCVRDRGGICHQLANDKIIKWVK